MTDKMEQIESKIKGTVEDTRRMVDVKYQVSQRPWAALGASVLIGYALGSIGGSDTSSQSKREETFRYYGQANDDRDRSAREYATNFGTASQARQEELRKASEPGFMDQIMDQFGDEIQLLKAAAISSVTGLIRDAVHKNLPGVQQELERMRGGQSTTPASRAYNTSGTSSNSGASQYYDTADTRLRERSVGELSTHADVGRSANYDFIPPAPHAEPGGRP